MTDESTGQEEGQPVAVNTEGGDAEVNVGGGQSGADQQQEQAEEIAESASERGQDRVQRGASGSIEGK